VKQEQPVIAEIEIKINACKTIEEEQAFKYGDSIDSVYQIFLSLPTISAAGNIEFRRSDERNLFPDIALK
jgi:hypothetical protein